MKESHGSSELNTPTRENQVDDEQHSRVRNLQLPADNERKYPNANSAVSGETGTPDSDTPPSSYSVHPTQSSARASPSAASPMLSDRRAAQRREFKDGNNGNEEELVLPRIKSAQPHEMTPTQMNRNHRTGNGSGVDRRNGMNSCRNAVCSGKKLGVAGIARLL